MEREGGKMKENVLMDQMDTFLYWEMITSMSKFLELCIHIGIFQTPRPIFFFSPKEITSHVVLFSCFFKFHFISIIYIYIYNCVTGNIKEFL